MNDRLVTALGALAAVAVLAVLLFPASQPSRIGRPTSADTGPNGYAALVQWLRSDGVAVKSLRRRASALTGDELALAPSGNLMITTMPHRNRLRRKEGADLWQWVARGNTLLVLAALDDTPDWVSGLDTSWFLADLTRSSGLEFEVMPASHGGVANLGRVGRTTPVILEGLPEHPLMAGVAELRGESDFPASLWQVKSASEASRGVLQLAREARSGAPAMWEAAAGRGQVIVSGLGSLLSNRTIGQGDNRAFVANLVRFHLAPGGAVIFDDMHQGLSVLYDPAAFFSDPRLGATLLFLLGFWALYLLGGNSRLGPVIQPSAAPRQGDFVAGVGGFLARKLSRADAGRLMIRAWLDEATSNATATGDPWQAVAAMPALDRRVLSRLEDLNDAIDHGDGVDLRELHDTIEKLRRMLG